MTPAYPTPASPEPCSSPLTLFVHVPKTAGTTFNSLLSYQYGHRRSLWVPWQDTDIAHHWRRMTAAQRHRLRLIRGHFPYGGHPSLQRPVRYVSMLRHPVDRVVSLYYYLLDEPDCADARAARAAKSVEAFVAGMQTHHVSNDQVRLLSGAPSRAGLVTADHLATAKRHVDEDFVCVGITERFPETVLLMAERLQWQRPLFYLSSKRNHRRPQVSELAPHVRRVIERYNEYDLELYEHVSRRFDLLLQDRAEDFAVAKSRLQRRNRIAELALPLPLWTLRRLRQSFTTPFVQGAS